MTVMVDSYSATVGAPAERTAPSLIALSIVIPIYNEAESLPRLFDTPVPILNLSYEIVAINDGSKNRSLVAR
jgi:cellulose synthase/poly-beta-1,6-N-acetylglucosamine synthase-like glycosyltransferase